MYYDKVGIKPVIQEEDNWVAKKVGHLLEDLVAEIFSQKTGLKVFQIKTMFSHPDYPFMRADVDYFIETEDGKRGILECKTTNYNCKDKWDNDAVPYNYELQGRHYMAVMNLDFVYFACLWGNSENDFVWRYVERDYEFEDMIIAEEKYFWEEYVQNNVEPDYTENSSLVLKSIRKHIGNADPTAAAINLDSSYSKCLEEYLMLKEQKKLADSEASKIEERMKKSYLPIVDKLGVHCEGVCSIKGTRYMVTYKPKYMTKIKKENLEKLSIHHRDIYDEYAETTESRSFAVKEMRS